MKDLEKYVFWFVAGSQHLYGPETLASVNSHLEIIARGFNKDQLIPFKVVVKPVLTTHDSIRRLCLDANSDDDCAGLITWMHTFSPAKMWIAGLRELHKPLLHLHTQFNRDIPWDSIDMDFMNLNQSAHGDREYGFLGARMRLARKVVVGYWEDPSTCKSMGDWMRSAIAYVAGQDLKVARFGDNMRGVAVTEGDKVEAQMKFGWSVDGFGIGELTDRMGMITELETDRLLEEYGDIYEITDETRSSAEAMDSIKEQARIELALRAFLEDGGFGAFTTNFEELHGMKQLPGLACQRLMADGYGFGGEGDWKTAALVRMTKVMADGLTGGTTFMEDYTYQLEQGNEFVLGAHMLEVCPSIAAYKPRIEVHSLTIGGKSAPARLVFDGAPGRAVCASLVDLGNRFRLIINEVDVVKIEKAMPRLPVARVLWKPLPSLRQSAEAWILSGGAHHTVLTFSIKADQFIDWADIAGVESLLINGDTDIRDFKNELRWNEIAFGMKQF